MTLEGCEGETPKFMSTGRPEDPRQQAPSVRNERSRPREECARGVQC